MSELGKAAASKHRLSVPKSREGRRSMSVSTLLRKDKEGTLFKKAWRDQIAGGLADRKIPEDFSSSSLERGKKVESEHTSNRSLATEIAMDHLTEDPGYYKKLRRMEKGAGLLDLLKTPIPGTKDWVVNTGKQGLQGAARMAKKPLMRPASVTRSLGGVTSIGSDELKRLGFGDLAKHGEVEDSEGLKEFRKQLKPGDILLTKALHPTLLSRLVSARQGSEYGHAALYAGGSEVIDTRVDKGVFETTLGEVRSKWGGGRDIRVYRPDAPQGERSTAVDNAKAYIGTPYSLKGALRMLLPAGKNKGLDPVKKDAIVCSQLIVRAYPKLNFARDKDRDHVLPVDFAKSPLTKRVAELSTDKTAEEKHKLHGHVKYQGLSIAIENRKGSVREGVDPDGKPWRTKFRYPYGYIKKTKGRDGEEIDVYIGPDPNAPEAFVVHQHHINGKGHDEDKVMLGFKSEEDARKAYLEHYDKAGIKLLGPISTIAVDELKRRLEEKREHMKLAWDGVGSGGGPTGNRMAMIDMDEKPDKSKAGDVPSRDGTSPGAARIERHEAGPDFMTTLPTNGALSSSGTGATTRL